MEHQLNRDGLTRRFRTFASREAAGSSPLYERLGRGLTDSPVLWDLYDVVEPRQQRPNLLLAALHAVVLAGTDHELADYYPSVGGAKPPDERLVDVAMDCIRGNRGRLRRWMEDRSTQTNEPRRSALVLAALNQIRWRGPAALVDVGAAAGLNLLLDRYGYRYGPQQINATASVQIECASAGQHPLPRLGLVQIADRIGVDLKPLSVTDPDDVLWLRACIWPEHRHRRELLDAAIQEARNDPPRIVRGDANHTLDDVIMRFSESSHVVVFHCATLAYMPAEERGLFSEQLERLARQRALSWVPIEGPFIPPYDRLDHDHVTASPVDSAYLTVGLTEWTDGPRRDLLLARADPHGAWIQWLQPSATAHHRARHRP